MSNIRIMTDNFIDLDIVSNATVSSEQAAFPIANIYNTQRRSKVWRSNGHYLIDATNNTIVFRETASTDITATITSGEYTSFALLAAEIKTQLEAGGASTYTIDKVTTTKKIRFTSNGVGGTGLFKIIWTSTAVTQATATMLGFLSTEDDTGFLTYTADELTTGNEEWIKWDFGISTNPKAFCLIGPRNSPIKISPSATLTLQASETDIWDVPSYEAVLTYNDEIISKFSTTGLHTEALRFWRLLIDDVHNPNGYVEVGSIFLGDFFTPTQGAAQFPLQGQYVDRSMTIFSEGGQSFSDVREQTENISFTIANLTVSEKEEIDVIFKAVGIAQPFFISIDPNAAYSSSTNYIRFVKFENAPQYSLDSAGLFSCNFNLREEL